MPKIQKIEQALLDIDGSCRDINFKNPTWNGACELIKSLEAQFDERAAYDIKGQPISEPHWKFVIEAAQKTDCTTLIYNGGTGLVKNLQILICKENDASPFIELTFFPDDIASTQNLGRQFIRWLKDMQSLLNAEHYYCRYENASWQLGDISLNSGVFVVSE